jgi:HEAT repeat protein
MQNSSASLQRILFNPLLTLAFILVCCSQPIYANGWEHTSIDFEVLLLALEDENPGIRQRAAESLGYRGKSGASVALLARLEQNETEARVRQAIYASLGKIGKQTALGAIRDCLEREEDTAGRAQCAGALGNFDSDLAGQLALEAVSDGSKVVRQQAIASLGSFSTSSVVQALVDLLGSDDDSIKNAALLSLGRTGAATEEPVLIESLRQSSDRNQTLISLQALTFLASSSSAAAIREVYEASADELVKRHALVALANTQAQGSESLFLDALSSEDPETRILGLAVLRNFAGRSEVPVIVEHALIESDYLFVSESDQLFLYPALTIQKLRLLNEYLKTIVRLDPASGEKIFLRSAKPVQVPRSSASQLKIAEGFYQARWQSLYGLGYTGTDKAGVIITQALTDADARIRAVAIRSMGVLENPGYLDSIQAMLSDEVAEVRWMAARVLGRLHAVDSTDALIDALDDSSAQVRLESVLALGYLGAHTAKEKIGELAANDPDQRVSEAAIYAASLIE